MFLSEACVAILITILEIIIPRLRELPHSINHLLAVLANHKMSCSDHIFRMEGDRVPLCVVKFQLLFILSEPLS